ncbi:MAG: GerMN domain-containing protein [Acidobacteriota bacterium]
MRHWRPLLAAFAVCAALAAVVLLTRRHAPVRAADGAAPTPYPSPVPVRVVLFFPGDDGLLHREVRETAGLSDATLPRARTLLEELLAGSREAWGPAFPWPAGVEAVFVDREGNAFVDFSAPPAGAVSGTASEIALVYSTVHTLVANCPGIERVQLLFDGHEVTTLGHLDLSRPLAPRPEMIAR